MQLVLVLLNQKSASVIGTVYSQLVLRDALQPQSLSPISGIVWKHCTGCEEKVFATVFVIVHCDGVLLALHKNEQLGCSGYASWQKNHD